MDKAVTVRADRGALRIARALAAGVALMISAAAGLAQASAAGAPMSVADPAARCAALVGRHVPAAAIGLPTRGADVLGAVLTPANAAASTPDYCDVRGAILASAPADPPIQFQLNLPTAWNAKAVQFGGGGLNGTVITGLGPAPHAP